jgi:hypothetical protein
MGQTQSIEFPTPVDISTRETNALDSDRAAIAKKLNNFAHKSHMCTSYPTIGRSAKDIAQLQTELSAKHWKVYQSNEELVICHPARIAAIPETQID